MGLLPSFKTKFIGIRYHYLHYQTVLVKDQSQFSTDFYKTAEIWGGWSIGSKWQVMTFVPYRFNKKISDDGIKKTDGLGDITLLTNYNLLHTRKVNTHNKVIEQQLWIGGGITLPTGAYHIDLSDPDANIGDANSQAGTGSTDFLINTTYNISIKNFGVNSSVNYKINTPNPDHYQFGNRLTISGLGYYRIRFAGIAVSPNLGLLYEHAGVNHYANDAVKQTGGYLLNGSGGVEVNFNKITVGINSQIPVIQNFAEGQTVSKARGVLHISFAL
ncbi:MAG: hypothetical protein NVSMB63_05440 [Sediminibacterium sp.]